MITYETAKQLKDAGYKFKECTLNEYGSCEQRHCNSQDNNCTPTLSELIDWCGGSFHSLEKGFGGYRAYSKHNKHGFSNHYKSPEEAVARLWLAISEKKHV